jgi:Nitrile hydratase, alpha chain/Nitrile hydratase beta subunit
VENVETRIGPHIGARVVARSWVDPEFKQRLLRDAPGAISSMAEFDPVAAHLIAVENTPRVHNIVVCTLCSCYPWSVLGLPPAWYKSAPYRSRVVIDPKGVLAEFGLVLPPETQIRIWDSTAETRFLVVPMRPEETDGWSEEQRPSGDAQQHDRNRAPAIARGGGRGGPAMTNSIHDMGGMHGFGSVEVEADEPPFHADWEKRVVALMQSLAMHGCGRSTASGPRWKSYPQRSISRPLISSAGTVAWNTKWSRTGSSA